mgnify:CR=1 FL=1
MSDIIFILIVLFIICLYQLFWDSLMDTIDNIIEKINKNKDKKFLRKRFPNTYLFFENMDLFIQRLNKTENLTIQKNEIFEAMLSIINNGICYCPNDKAITKLLYMAIIDDVEKYSDFYSKTHHLKYKIFSTKPSLNIPLNLYDLLSFTFLLKNVSVNIYETFRFAYIMKYVLIQFIKIYYKDYKKMYKNDYFREIEKYDGNKIS